MNTFNTTLTMEQLAILSTLNVIGESFKKGDFSKHIEGEGRDEALKMFGAYCVASEDDKLQLAEAALENVEALLAKCEEYKKIITQAAEEGTK